MEDERAPRLAIVIGGLMLVMLLASLDQTIVSTALPTIVGDLGGLKHLSWVVTAYLLAITVVTPLYGKLGDQLGRKVVLQGALVVFLIGSALCGLAESMPQLIAFRAVQGLGGGGLMVSAQAAIGDVVSPRERGQVLRLLRRRLRRLVDPGAAHRRLLHDARQLARDLLHQPAARAWRPSPSWPSPCPAPGSAPGTSIDWLGTPLLAAGLTSIVLVTTLGGTTYDWGSPQIVGLGAPASWPSSRSRVAERRAAEPILPLRLFRNPVFRITSAVGFVVGFALFGALTYLPLFQQVVRGLSPTASGLQLVPLMAGLLVSSIGSGQIISRTGHYKAFPIAGTAISAVGLLLLTTPGRDHEHERGRALHARARLRAGPGHAGPRPGRPERGPLRGARRGHLVGTLFRSTGGSMGTAVLGAIFTNRLTDLLAQRLPTGAGAPASGSIDPSAVHRLPAAIRDPYLGSFTDAVGSVFLVAAIVVAVAFVLAWFLPERPLRRTVEGGARLDDTFAPPRDADSMDELARRLRDTVGLDRTRRFLADTARAAGLDLSPAEAYLLGRAADGLSVDPAGVAAERDLDAGRLAAGPGGRARARPGRRLRRRPGPDGRRPRDARAARGLAARVPGGPARPGARRAHARGRAGRLRPRPRAGDRGARPVSRRGARPPDGVGEADAHPRHRRARQGRRRHRRRAAARGPPRHRHDRTPPAFEGPAPGGVRYLEADLTDAGSATRRARARRGDPRRGDPGPRPPPAARRLRQQPPWGRSTSPRRRAPRRAAPRARVERDGPGFLFPERPFLADYAPVDEEHPVASPGPLRLSKRFGEELMDALVARSDVRRC